MKYILPIIFTLFIYVTASAQNTWNSSLKEKEQIESELKVYPNPSKNNKVTVELQSKEIAEIHFINITGKEVMKEMYDFPVQKSTIQLNQLPNGIYILRIITSDQNTFTRKLMVSRN
ncbi:T9SS type A sorting domain-containing protein [Maribellus sp. YY47]|uniref:T9SS type A sorting domain-containing protein n=1 Tax=Maribellus sp. YY47 TaxID=2929486 RepID=UPI002001BE34|nr:T9SS type A sorting domain-containing protein [Maribellus sp. YY47]MCK3685905.1 T9SS type A sorting domain-containing protein [Maribellus sp. YY47]